MSNEKLKRLISSIVATAVMLLFILLSIMVYQMIALKNVRKKIDGLNEQIRVLQEEKEGTQSEIEIWLSDWKIEERQRELGWVYEQDK